MNGVRVVHNEKGGQWGANLEVKLELIRTIGGLDAEESLSFNEPSDIVRDSAGSLYILDSGNNRIQKLNSEGKFIKTIGRKGQGPGEFQAARSMDIDKLEIFSPDGVLLGEIPLTHHAHGIRIFGDNLFIREYNNTIFYQYKIIDNESH
ncbi:MAG: 6-bladed beta-propeller [Candidatus Aminicenantes bacterium]|nr:6-bladed beta-propeller [Candidatus Aminicenantes bacterium]